MEVEVVFAPLNLCNYNQLSASCPILEYSETTPVTIFKILRGINFVEGKMSNVIFFGIGVSRSMCYICIYILYIHNAVTFCIITVRQGQSWPQANIFYNISIVIYFIVLLSWR